MSRSSRLARYGWQPAEAARRPVLFVNPRSGAGKAARARLDERARERGVEVRVLATDQRLQTLVADAVASGADLLGMAGGDGSLAIVAAAAREHGLPFVCIPAGTRNHFALDVGVDRNDLVGALDSFTDGVERRIDLGEVNGRMFLNNVSLGIYGDAVREHGYREAKVRTLFESTHAALGPGASLPPLELVDDVGHEHRAPAVVLVSNNAYALKPPPAGGTRPALDRGELGIIVLERPGQADGAGRAWSASSLEVRGAGPVSAGVDGEAVELHPPLEFHIQPHALRVRISARHPGVSPSGLLR